MSSLWTEFNNIKQINMVNYKGGLTPKQLKIKYPLADIICNLTLYVLANGINFVSVEDENVKDGYLGGDGIGIVGKKNLTWCTAKEAYASEDIRDFCGGFPPLVKDGKKFVDKDGKFYWGAKYSSYVDGTHKRVLIGFNKGLLILVATDNAITLHKAADIMISFGCDYAINGDGGLWSPHLQKGNKVIRQGYRKNPTWLLIYLDKRKEFIKLALDQVGKSYIWGANGEILTPSLLNRFISWFGKSHYVNSSFDVTKTAQMGKEAFDCSGLIVYLLRELGLISGSQDYNAAMLYAKCGHISFNDIKDGDLIFYSNLGHVGIYNQGNIIEARGSKYGVVITKRIKDFTKVGRLHLLD